MQADIVQVRMLCMVADPLKHGRESSPVFAADEYTSATHDLERLLEFAQGPQGSTFPGLVQQCQDQRASLLEVGPCLCMYC